VTKILKQIAVSEDNYRALKSLGSAGDSFNDVITAVLRGVSQKGVRAPCLGTPGPIHPTPLYPEDRSG